MGFFCGLGVQFGFLKKAALWLGFSTYQVVFKRLMRYAFLRKAMNLAGFAL